MERSLTLRSMRVKSDKARPLKYNYVLARAS